MADANLGARPRQWSARACGLHRAHLLQFGTLGGQEKNNLNDVLFLLLIRLLILPRAGRTQPEIGEGDGFAGRLKHPHAVNGVQAAGVIAN